jgi:hypothetical protein
MRQLTFIKKARVEWREVPEPQLTDSLQAIVRPFVAGRGRRALDQGRDAPFIGTASELLRIRIESRHA